MKGEDDMRRYSGGDERRGRQGGAKDARLHDVVYPFERETMSER